MAMPDVDFEWEDSNAGPTMVIHIKIAIADLISGESHIIDITGQGLQITGKVEVKKEK